MSNVGGGWHYLSTPAVSSEDILGSFGPVCFWGSLGPPTFFYLNRASMPLFYQEGEKMKLSVILLFSGAWSWVNTACDECWHNGWPYHHQYSWARLLLRCLKRQGHTAPTSTLHALANQPAGIPACHNHQLVTLLCFAEDWFQCFKKLWCTTLTDFLSLPLCYEINTYLVISL